MEYEITGHTTLIGLLGSPVGHSLSPMMHNEAFRTLGLDYCYLAFDVDEGGLKAAVEGLKAMGARGMNLTMPCKNAVVPLCDRLSPAAQICGAVNTVVIEKDRTMTGHTTDGVGFFEACREEGFQLRGKKMTILGAGGAATAIFVQAALDGASAVTIFTRSSSPFLHRTRQVVDALRQRTGCELLVLDYDGETLKREIFSSQLLVNGTSVGMAPSEEGCLLPDTSFFHPKLTVADIIYNPRETRLVRMAKEVGCRAFGGSDMLLYQGAEAFRLWTGEQMPVERIRERYF